MDDRLSDSPTVEYQLGRMANAITGLLEATREIKQSQEETKDEISRLKFYQLQQNGNVARLQEDRNIISRRMDAHDDWHGEEDDRILQRIRQEEKDKSYQEGKHSGVKTVLGIQLKIVQWAAGGGLVGAGLVIGKLVNIAGWW